MLKASDPESLARARDVLLRGGVLAFPTETVYGLGVLHGLTAAADRLRALKGRDAAKPFQILVAGAATAETAARVTPAARRVLEKFWPGPLTVVLPAAADPAATVGLRAPDLPWLQSLLALLPAGITATSANLAGRPPATSGEEAEAAVGALADLVIDGGPSAIGRASTVVSLAGEDLRILREGAIAEAELRAVYAGGREI